MTNKSRCVNYNYESIAACIKSTSFQWCQEWDTLQSEGSSKELCKGVTTTCIHTFDTSMSHYNIYIAQCTQLRYNITEL